MTPKFGLWLIYILMLIVALLVYIAIRVSL